VDLNVLCKHSEDSFTYCPFSYRHPLHVHPWTLSINNHLYLEETRRGPVCVLPRKPDKPPKSEPCRKGRFLLFSLFLVLECRGHSYAWLMSCLAPRSSTDQRAGPPHYQSAPLSRRVRCITTPLGGIRLHGESGSTHRTALARFWYISWADD
jgi:hypothetical protein